MKSSAIRKQNNQAIPAGSRLWTPANIGNDLVYWMRPEMIRPHNGESTSTSDLAQNKWIDSSFNGYEAGTPTNQQFSSINTCQFQSAGISFGTQNAKTFPTYRSSNGSQHGGCLSFSDSNAPRIDPGTGAFTIIGVCRLTRSESASVPYSGTKLTIASDGNGSSSASDFIYKLTVSSNGSSDPSTLVISAKCGSSTLSNTVESKAGNSQIFDEDSFMFAYDRDGSGNAELFNNGVSLATGTGHDADMADTGPRNIFGLVSAQATGFIYGADNGGHRMAETICFNNDDATTRILCEGYLAHKYGRQNKLASTHKYRYGPPRV